LLHAWELDNLSDFEFYTPCTLFSASAAPSNLQPYLATASSLQHNAVATMNLNQQWPHSNDKIFDSNVASKKTNFTSKIDIN
jgi:hypothetical protein